MKLNTRVVKKNLKPHPERSSRIRTFLWWQYITYKTKKTNSEFCLNFCVGVGPYNSERCEPSLKCE